MAEYLSEYVVDLAVPPWQKPVPHQFAMGDNNAYTFTSLLCNSRNPEAELMAGDVTGELVRPDGATVAIAGTKGDAVRQVTLEDGTVCNATPCSVTLPQSCFTCPGRVILTIKLTSGTTITQALNVTAMVARTTTDVIIDPGEVVPDIGMIRQAALDADAAADNANAAADHGVRTDKAQELTDTQMRQGRANIDAASSSAVNPGMYEDTGRELLPSQITNNKLIIISTGDLGNAAGRAVTVYMNGTYPAKAISVNAPGFLYRIFWYTGTTVSSYDGYDEIYYPCDGTIHAIDRPGNTFRLTFYHDPVDSVAFTEEEIAALAAGLVRYDYIAAGVQELRQLATNAVRYNEAQSLTDSQKAQARENIGAISTAAVAPGFYRDTGRAMLASQITKNKLIISTTGEEGSAPGRAITVYNNGTYPATAISINATGYLYRIFWYNWATGATYDGYDETYYPCDGKIRAIDRPDRAYRITFYHNPVDDVAFTDAECETLAAGVTWYGYVSSEIEALEQKAAQAFVQIPVAFAGHLSPLSYLNGENGTKGSVWKHTTQIDIRDFSLLRYKNATTSTAGSTMGMAFYDGAGAYISGWSGLHGETLGYVERTVYVPHNAVYAAFSAYQDTQTYGEFALYGVLRAPDYPAAHWVGKHWYAYGTSLTSTVLGKYAPVVAERLGLVLTNKGISGGGLVTNGLVKDAVMDLTDGKLEADLITLEVGANDKTAPLGTIQDTGDSTICGALNQCIRYLQENTTAQIVVMSSTTSITYQEEPVTPATQYPGGYTQFELAQAIENVCKVNGVWYIPTGEGIGMGWARIKSGTYVRDNIHHTNVGGYNLAMGIVSRLKDIPLWYCDPLG